MHYCIYKLNKPNILLKQLSVVVLQCKHLLSQPIKKNKTCLENS